jgi:hypothetical protein
VALVVETNYGCHGNVRSLHRRFPCRNAILPRPSKPYIDSAGQEHSLGGASERVKSRRLTTFFTPRLQVALGNGMLVFEAVLRQAASRSQKIAQRFSVGTSGLRKAKSREGRQNSFFRPQGGPFVKRRIVVPTLKRWVIVGERGTANCSRLAGSRRSWRSGTATQRRGYR